MNDMNGQGNGEEPDYQAAFKRACADIGAINALLGFNDHPGIDRILRAITDLQLASRTRSVPEGLTAALMRYDALMASVEGCTDGGCVIRSPKWPNRKEPIGRAMNAMPNVTNADSACAVAEPCGKNTGPITSAAAVA